MSKDRNTVPINVLDPPYSKKEVGKIAVDKNGKAPSCVYDHETHGAGSIIKHRDGTKSICSEDGTWQNSK